MVNVGKLAFCAVLFLALSGCAGANFNVFEESEALPQFHPPLPAPLVPVNPDPVIATPDLTEIWNREIDAGEREPYVVYGFHVQDWISLGQYDDRKDYYIRTLLEIIKWYGHPSLNKEEKPDDSVPVPSSGGNSRDAGRPPEPR
jgi:hypothetical protein